MTHPTALEADRFLAGTLADLGDLQQSYAVRLAILRRAEQEFGADHHETATYRNSLAIAERRLGNYTAARREFERVLSAVTARYGESHDFVATTRLNLAIVDANLGDIAAARRDHTVALRIWERSLGPTHPYVAVALTELAAAYRELGRPNQALPLIERALAIREASLGPTHRDVATTLADAAATLAALGRVARAQQLAIRAVNIWNGLDAPEAPEFAAVMALYADLQARRGDYVAAREYYSRALAIRAKVFGETHPLHADAEAGLAAALAHLGNPAALAHAEHAESRGRDHLRLMLRTLPERQALQYAAARPEALDLILSLATSAPEATRNAADGMVRSRALVLDEMAARRSALTGSPEADGAGSQAMLAAQQRLANLLVRGAGSMTATQYTALVDRARAESEAAEQALAAESAAFRAERSRTQVGVEQVLGALPADAALLSFVRYDRTPRSPTPGAPPPAALRAPARPVASYLAFVLRAGQPAVAVPVGTVQAVDSLVAQWRADIAGAVTTSAAPESARASGAALRRQVWDRVAAHLGDAARVFIVPDGTLGLVPFAALPMGERSYLIERGPVVHYLSAERDIVAHASTSSSPNGLLAIGGPSFNDASMFASRARPRTPVSTTATATAAATLRGAAMPCGGLQQITFEPLGGTRQEVRDLSGVWNTGATATMGQAQVLIGRDASETAFKRGAAGYRVLHLATHGFFLNGDCAAAPIGTRGVGGLSSAGPRRQPANPLLLSGLALAGANRRSLAGPDEDDGILTADEVASLNLERGRVGGALGLRHRRRRDSRRRRGLRAAARVPGRRCADRRHEPVVGGRSGDPRLDEGALRRAVPAPSLNRGRRPPGQPVGAARAPRHRPQHASVLLGGVRRRRRLALDGCRFLRRAEFQLRLDDGSEGPPYVVSPRHGHRPG